MVRGDCTSEGVWQRGTGHRGVANLAELGQLGNRKRRATAPWDGATSRNGVVNHGSPMGSLTAETQQNALDGREVLAGVRVDPEAPGSMA